MLKNTNSTIPLFPLLSTIGLLVAATLTIDENLNNLGIYIILPLSFIISFKDGGKSLCLNYVSKTLLLIYTWIMICIPFAYDMNASLPIVTKILGCLILIVTVSRLERYDKLRHFLLLLPILSLSSLWYYAYNNLIEVVSFGEERLNESGVLNANAFGYYSFYSIFSIYLFGELFHGYLKRIFRVLLFFAAPMIFFTAMYTCSRQIIIISFPLWAILLLIRYFKFSYKRIAIIAIFVLTLTYLFNTYGLSIYDNSLLQQRSEASIEDDERAEILQDCLNIGVANPIVGVGPLNARLFTRSGHMAHNSFAELFADTGYIGFFLFSFLVLSFILVQMKRYQVRKDKFYLSFIIFGCMWILYQFLYVFYDNMWLITYFVYISVFSDLHFSTISKNDESN